MNVAFFMFFRYKNVTFKGKVNFLAVNCQNSSRLGVFVGGESIASIISDAWMNPRPKNIEIFDFSLQKRDIHRKNFQKSSFSKKIFIQRCSAHRVGSEKHQNCARSPKNMRFFIENTRFLAQKIDFFKFLGQKSSKKIFLSSAIDSTHKITPRNDVSEKNFFSSEISPGFAPPL